MTHLTYRDALNNALFRVMERDHTVVVWGEDVVGGSGVEDGSTLGGVFGVTKGLKEKFGPLRVFDTPISEAAFVGMATGAGMTGLKPVIELMFCDFMGVCFDQIMNQAAKLDFLSAGKNKSSLVIRTTMGAGDSSGAVHSQSLGHLVASIPGLTVAMPSSPAVAGAMLELSINHAGPVIFMEHRGMYDFTELAPDNFGEISIGKGRVIQKGTDVTIVALSKMVYEVSRASKLFEGAGTSIEIVDPLWASPIDYDLILESVKKTGRLIVVDEGAARCGLASEIISTVCSRAFSDLRAAPIAVTPPHTPVPYATKLEKAWLPDFNDIKEAIQTVIHSQDRD